jgi:hypothetical protein
MNAEDVLEEIVPVDCSDADGGPPNPAILAERKRAVDAARGFTPEGVRLWTEIVPLYNRTSKVKLPLPSDHLLHSNWQNALGFLASGAFLYLYALHHLDERETSVRILAFLSQSAYVNQTIPKSDLRVLNLWTLILNQDLFIKGKPRMRTRAGVDDEVAEKAVPEIIWVDDDPPTPVSIASIENFSRQIKVESGRRTIEKKVDKQTIASVATKIEGGDMYKPADSSGPLNGDDATEIVLKTVQGVARAIRERAIEVIGTLRDDDPCLGRAFAKFDFDPEPTLSEYVLPRIADLVNEVEMFQWPPLPKYHPTLVPAIRSSFALVNAGLAQLRRREIAVEDLPRMRRAQIDAMLSVIEQSVITQNVEFNPKFPSSYLARRGRLPASAAIYAVQKFTDQQK